MQSYFEESTSIVNDTLDSTAGRWRPLTTRRLWTTRTKLHSICQHLAPHLRQQVFRTPQHPATRPGNIKSASVGLSGCWRSSPDAHRRHRKPQLCSGKDAVYDLQPYKIRKTTRVFTPLVFYKPQISHSAFTALFSRLWMQDLCDWTCQRGGEEFLTILFMFSKVFFFCVNIKPNDSDRWDWSATH